MNRDKLRTSIETILNPYSHSQIRFHLPEIIDKILDLFFTTLNEPKFSEWKIDVTFESQYCFIPYSNGNLYEAFCVRAERSPGKLVGVVHTGGSYFVQKWINKHPEWEVEFGPNNEYKKEVSTVKGITDM